MRTGDGFASPTSKEAGWPMASAVGDTNQRTVHLPHLQGGGPPNQRLVAGAPSFSAEKGEGRTYQTVLRRKTIRPPHHAALREELGARESMLTQA